jgi:hypothetical protein
MFATRVVVVHAGGGSSIVAGVIGGLVVLIGVVLTDQFTRLRERRGRLEEAWYAMQASASTLMSGNISHLSSAELTARYAQVMSEAGRIYVAAKWPTRRAKQIRTEVDALTVRFIVAMSKWTSGREGPPKLGPVIGERLGALVFPDSMSRGTVNAALKAEGLPSLEDSDPEARHNIPLGEQQPDH